MKTPTEVVLEALKRLRLNEREEGDALRLLALHAIKPQRLKSLHEEWALDVVMDKKSSVDGHEKGLFLSWLKGRLKTPFYIPRHKISRVRQSWGEEMAIRAEILFWPSAQAWARQFRRHHGEDYAVCLAHAWLHGAMNDPGKHFVRHSSACAHLIASGCTDFAEWTSPTDVQNISFPIGSKIVSAWERQADEMYGSKILQDKKRLTSLAEACRNAGEVEDMKLETQERADSILREAPHMRITSLSAAVNAGLSSDDVLNALATFIASPPQKTGGMPWHYLLSRTYPNFIGSAQPLDDSEKTRRLNEISSLDTTWVEGIPEDWKGMLDGRAASPHICSVWVQDVVEGRRNPPLDLLLDYGLWLAERR
jgi:hypothetical protein